MHFVHRIHPEPSCHRHGSNVRCILYSFSVCFRFWAHLDTTTNIAARREGTQPLRCSMGRCSRCGSLKAAFRWWYQDAPFASQDRILTSTQAEGDSNVQNSRERKLLLNTHRTVGWAKFSCGAGVFGVRGQAKRDPALARSGQGSSTVKAPSPLRFAGARQRFRVSPILRTPL